jgi:peptide/nickel transport system permease protein
VAGSSVVIFCVVTVTFLVTRVFAPDPTALFLAPAGNGFVSPAAAAAEKAKVQASLGLGKPLIVEYYRFLDQLAHANLGTSFETGRPVTADLLDRLPATLELAVYALVCGVSVGVLAGVVAAVRREGVLDHVVRFFTIGGLSLPQFWVGLMLLWVFFTELHIAPGPIGRLPVGITPPHTITGFYVIDGLLEGRWAAAAGAARQLALPVLTLAIGLAGPIVKIVRSSMVDALGSDYVRTATAMGFGRRRIWLVYALKNGLLPVLTVLAGIIAYTFCGSVLVEGVFGWPGVGNYALQAIQNSDFPAVQGFVVYAAVLYVVIYSLLDYVYAFVDPRIRS